MTNTVLCTMKHHWQLLVTISLLLLPWIQANDSNNHNKDATSSDADDDEDFWKTASLYEMSERLLCDEVHLNQNNPNAFQVHGREVWNMLRKVYREIVGNESSSIPPAEEDDREPTDGTRGNTGFFLDTEVIMSTERGRGNYASQDLPKGSMIWKSKYTATFTSGDQYRAYLRAIPPSLACEILTWAYTRIAPSGEIVACVDLEPGSFTNHASTPDKLNMELGTPEKPFKNTGCDLEFYASRDIPKGEELLMDYGMSERSSGWIAMGLAPKRTKYRYEENEEDEEEEEEEEDEEEDGNDEDEEEDDEEEEAEL